MRAPAALALAGLAACSGAPPPHGPPPAPAGTAYHAVVRWTSDGVPHITGDDWGSLGFGQGWALAALHLCEVEDQVVRVRGERARFFGPGDDDANLDSDFFHLHLGFAAHAAAADAAQGAASPGSMTRGATRLSPEARALGHGFALGFDRWIAAHPPQTWPAPCRGAAWVRPISDDDLTAVALAISTTASSRAVAPLIARAAPRPAKAARVSLPAATSALASNAWAVGAERTSSGGGLLLANPHFPWEGELQFYESHLTIPGTLDVYGAALLATPLVQIGFNAKVAWTHTFSSSTHFVIYRVPLAKDQPLRIAVGDTPEPIAPATYTIQVKQPDGSLRDVTRTLYRTRWGPMVDSAELPWDPASGHAFTLVDVALDDSTALDEYLAFARAGKVADVDAALAASHTPFVNTIAADDAGDALYVDASRVPALGEDGLATWTIARHAMPALAAAWAKGVVVLDAALPVFALAGDRHGALPIDAHTPRLARRDWVINANAHFAFSHRGVAMPGNTPLYGDDRAPSPRTLANWALLAGDARLDRKAAAALLFSNRSSTAEALADDVVAGCTPPRVAPRRGSLQPKEMTPHDPACDALAAWDRRFGVDSRGAALWRELMVELAPGGRIPWAHPYDPADPATPHGLALAAPAIRSAVAAAAARLADAGVDLRAPLGAVQTTPRGDGRAAVPGGSALDGVADVTTWEEYNGTLLPREQRGPQLSKSGLGKGGYPIDYGTSFVMAVDLTRDGPHADVLLTYGNSSDPASPHHRDQLDAFAAGRLRPARFTAADIAADQAAHPDLPTDDLRYTEPAR
jgi:acyl-homoserine-lactone acylase